ncbi:hypothetical protein BDB00DRAFT_795919 [Zychaea mexicana]|uniref:uncharacterized protein n=1 Tax=Zychaea mexicana TaxID=64656 RepID=UPI0022FDEC4E|nr:uncharacterized protein BDB00DRAFT_795919 [Zychaea mexicana]KAI9499225.1 hypothetical protein BDB00DRAFT_795919 [Zychaea mexicana]
MSSTLQMFFNRLVAKPSYVSTTATPSDNNNNNNGQDFTSGDSASEDSCYIETPVDPVAAATAARQQQQPQPCAPAATVPAAVAASPIPIQQPNHGYPSPGSFLSPYAQNVTSPLSMSDLSNSPDRTRTDFMPNIHASSFGSHSSLSVPPDETLYFPSGSYDQDFPLGDLLGEQQQLPPNADPDMLWVTPQHSSGDSSQLHQQQQPPTLALTTTSSVESNNYMQVRGSRASSCSQTPLLALGGSSIDSFGSFQAPPSQASSYSHQHHHHYQQMHNNNNNGGAIDIPQQQQGQQQQQSSSDLFGSTINPQCITTPILSISPAQASCSSSILGNMMDHLVIASPSVHSEHSVFSNPFQQQQQQQQQPSTISSFDDQLLLQPHLHHQQHPHQQNESNIPSSSLPIDWDIYSWVKQQQLYGSMMYEEQQLPIEDHAPSPISEQEQQQVVCVKQADTEEAAPAVSQQQQHQEQRQRRRQQQRLPRSQRRQQQRPRRPPAIRRTIHKCPKCSHTSNRANNMKEHILTHDPNREKNFACDSCAKAFARKYDMERHRKTHERRKKPRYPESGTVVFR